MSQKKYNNRNKRYSRKNNYQSRRYETPTIIVVNGESESKKKSFNWASLILLLIGLVCIGLSTYFLGESFKKQEESAGLITASASEQISGLDSNDYFDLTTAPKLVKKAEKSLGVRYTMTRTDILDSRTFNLGDGCTASFYFTVKLNEKDEMQALVYATEEYFYFYVHENSYPGYVIDLNIGSQSYPLHVGQKKIQSEGVYYDNYFCVARVNNYERKILPWTNNEMTFDLYGTSVDPLSAYEVVIDFSILCRSSEQYKVYISAPGWEGFDNWTGGIFNEAFGNYQYVNKYYLITSAEGSLAENNEAISYGECKVGLSALHTKSIALRTILKTAFDTNNTSVLGAENSTTYLYAKSLVDNVVTKNLTFRYLENIPFTPFAHMKEVANVSITYADDNTGVISLESVKGAFKAKGLTFPTIACNSAIKHFKTTNGTVFIAEYYASVYVGLKTEEGKVDYKTLDCNQSFSEFYSPISSTLGEIFNDGGKSFLDVVVNNIIVREYPVLRDSYELNEYDNLYGLWGWGVLPHTEAFNLNDLFFANTDTKTENVLKCYTFKGNMTNEQYVSLLGQYGYSNFYQTVNGTADWFKDDTDCTYMVFFCDGAEERSVISQGGNTDLEDEDSAWKDKVQDGWNEFLKGLSIFEDPKKLLTLFCGGLGLIIGIYVLYLGIMKIRRK